MSEAGRIIAKTLLDHRAAYRHDSENYVCGCGKKFTYPHSHRAHVAAEMEKELGLETTVEDGVRLLNGAIHPMSKDNAVIHERLDSGVLTTRTVTSMKPIHGPWEEAE